MCRRLLTIFFCSTLLVLSSVASRADTQEAQLLQSILTKLDDMSNGSDNFLFTVPLDNDTDLFNISEYLSDGLFDGGYWSGTPFLKLIQEDLRRIRFSSHSSSNSLIQILDSLQSLSSHLHDTTYSNSLESISSYLDSIDSRLYSAGSNLQSIDANSYDSLTTLNSLDRNLSSLSDFLSQFEYSYGLWSTHVDDNQWLNLESGIQEILDSLAELGSEKAADYAQAISDLVNGWDETTAPSWLTRIESYLNQSSDTLSDIHSNDLYEIYINLSHYHDFMTNNLVPTVKHIDDDFHSLLSYTTNSTVLPGFSETAGLTNAPSPSAQQREFDQYSSSATSAETQYSSDLSKYESGLSYQLPTLDFSRMIPGEITPLRAFEPSFDSTPQLSDDYSIPILSSDLHAGGVTISAFSLDLSTGSAYDNVMRPFKERVGPITEQIWNLIFAISVLLLAKYEWKMYMTGVGPQIAAEEQQARQDYDGYVF